jgi:hypothetical protein
MAKTEGAAGAKAGRVRSVSGRQATSTRLGSRPVTRGVCGERVVLVEQAAEVVGTPPTLFGGGALGHVALDVDHDDVGGLRSRAERLQRALIGLVGGEARNRELLQPPLRHLLAEKAPTIVSTIQTAATMPRSRTIASARRARDPRGASPVSVVSRDQLLSASRSLRAASWEAAA